MNAIIAAWLLIVSSPSDQVNMPFFESKNDCIEAAILYKRIKKGSEADCIAVDIELVENKTLTDI